MSRVDINLTKSRLMGSHAWSIHEESVVEMPDNVVDFGIGDELMRVTGCTFEHLKGVAIQCFEAAYSNAAMCMYRLTITGRDVTVFSYKHGVNGKHFEIGTRTDMDALGLSAGCDELERQYGNKT